MTDPFFGCPICGTRVDGPQIRCDDCAYRLGPGKRGKTFSERKLERTRRCLVCGVAFTAIDERVSVPLPKHVKPAWTPRSCVVHDHCAPVGQWPLNAVPYDEALATDGAA